MTIIDGKKVSEIVADELTSEIAILKQNGIIPTLVIIQVGSNAASDVYVRNKLRLSDRLGAKTIVKKLDANITQTQLHTIIKELNADVNVNGILVQLPIPVHLNESLVIEEINPEKDVDCFHLSNVGKLWTAKKSEVLIKPCTPAGIIELIKHYHIPIENKNVVVVGRSNIVGKPLSALLLLENATVTLCHSKTDNIKNTCKHADILIVAIGKAKLINHEYVKDGAVVVDVGINREADGKLYGDVDFEDIKGVASYITPVPGGVGPMTVTMLMKNLITLTKRQRGVK